MTLNATVQAAVGPMALILETEADAWYVPRMAGDGQYFYNSVYDNLIRVGRVDGSILNRALLLFYAWRSPRNASFLVGISNEYVKGFASGRDRDRLGAALVFNAGEEIEEIQRLQVALIGGVNMIDHNYQYDPFFQLVIRMYWDVYL